MDDLVYPTSPDLPYNGSQVIVKLSSIFTYHRHMLLQMAAGYSTRHNRTATLVALHSEEIYH